MRGNASEFSKKIEAGEDSRLLPDAESAVAASWKLAATKRTYYANSLNTESRAVSGSKAPKGA